VTAWENFGGWKPPVRGKGPGWEAKSLVFRFLEMILLEIFAADDFLRLVHFWMSNTSMNFEF